MSVLVLPHLEAGEKVAVEGVLYVESSSMPVSTYGARKIPAALVWKLGKASILPRFAMACILRTTSTPRFGKGQHKAAMTTETFVL